MIYIYLILISALSAVTVQAQSRYDKMLEQVEANSIRLRALSEQMEAQKLASCTGIFLTNPEVEFNYLWGNPSVIGNRTDFKVKQSFDFPSAYAYRSQIAGKENANAELMYKSERINLLLSAKEICIRLTYYNALAKQCEVRLHNARQIAQSFKQKAESGDANVIETNKAQLNLTNVENELAQIEVERQGLLSELKRLNGGAEIRFDDTAFIHSAIAADFESWYAEAEVKSPVLQYVQGQIEINEKRVSLNKAMGLPKFSAGYMMEKVVGQNFQGVSVGVSIPLWENKNRVKQAKADVKASQTVAEDTRVQFYNELQNLFARATTLQKSVASYRSSLSNHNNEELLKKALDGGEISLLDYLMETQYYYNAIGNLLASERDLELSIAQLSAVEL